MTLCETLQESGLTVVEAKDGAEAWKQIRNGAIHCVVMDMKMRGFDGIEVLTRMMGSATRLPVVVMSAFEQLVNDAILVTYPRLKFLAKPATPEQVLGAVHELLGNVKHRPAQTCRSRSYPDRVRRLRVGVDRS